MADIRIALNQTNELDKSIGLYLLDFYTEMKEQEKDLTHGRGKRAALVVMGINDIKEIFEKAKK